VNLNNISNERKSSEYFDAKDHFSEERSSEDNFYYPNQVDMNYLKIE